MAEADKNTTSTAQTAQAAASSGSQGAPEQEPQASPADQAKQAAEQAKQTADQLAGGLKQGAEQAKQTADQLAGGLKQGMEKLQKSGVTQIFKAAGNQPKVTTEEKLWAGLSYIPLVALAALVIKPDSGYIKLHGRQGLLIFIVFFLCIFIYIVPYIGPVFGGLIQFALFVVGIFSMYQAFIGNWWKIPALGDLAEMIPIGMFTQVTKEVITGQPAPQETPAAPVEGAPPQQPESAATEPQAGQPPSDNTQTPTASS